MARLASARIRYRVGMLMSVAALSACREATSHTSLLRDAGTTTAPTSLALQPPAFCARPGADAVRDVFCTDSAPAIQSLTDLQKLLHLAPPPTTVEAGPGAGVLASMDAYYSANYYVALGHSTALSGHVVSTINPRLIVINDVSLMAFQRGVPRVELATVARSNDGSENFDFYLLSFSRPCSATTNGCSPGELYTPGFESDWTDIQIQDDEDLKDSALDCRQCHQRGRATPSLLMREIDAPWTHYFEPIALEISNPPLPGVTASQLTADYVAAKGDETYGGFSLAEVPNAGPFNLEMRVGEAQPLLFDAPQIEGERFPYGPDGYSNVAMPSPTWDANYAAFKRGEQLALPAEDARPSDPQKLAMLTNAYTRYRTGEISTDELPDMTNVFPDDPQTRARIGLQTDPDAGPADALIQACGSCHNDRLDQTISRAHFNIAVSRMERHELELAAARIELSRDAPGAMPPPEARQLEPGVRDQLLEYLRSDPRPTDTDAQLEHAAQLGMTGGGRL